MCEGLEMQKTQFMTAVKRGKRREVGEGIEEGDKDKGSGVERSRVV